MLARRRRRHARRTQVAVTRAPEPVPTFNDGDKYDHQAQPVACTPARRPQLTARRQLSVCEVWLSCRGERRVNAKSIMGRMMLAAGGWQRGGRRDQRANASQGSSSWTPSGADRRQPGEGKRES
jgi:hypothetical protein